MGFNDYNLVVIEGESKNIEDGSEIANNHDSFESMKQSLRAFGGSGKLDKSKFIYRKVMGNVVPLGIGLTENPAADVKGIAISKPEELKSEANLEENISKIENLNVNTDINKKVMKITSIKDITDESLKQVSASQVSDFIEQELKSASEKFAAEKATVENQLKATKENLDSLIVNQENLQKEINSLKEALSTAEAEKQKILAAEQFNERMNGFDSEYDLDDETRQVLASEIADMSDEAFAAYKNKMAVFLKNKKKGAKMEKTEDDSKEAKASVTEVVEEVADKAEKKVVDMPMTSSASQQTFFEKYKQAFDYEGFVVR